MLKIDPVIDDLPAGLPPGQYYATRVINAEWKGEDFVVKLQFVGPSDRFIDSLFRIKSEGGTDV